MGEVEVRKERKGVEDKSLGFTEERLEGAEKGEGVSQGSVPFHSQVLEAQEK